LIKHLAAAMWGDAGIARHFNFYARYGEWSAYRPLATLKSPWFPLDRRLIWFQSVWPLHTREKFSTPIRN